MSYDEIKDLVVYALNEGFQIHPDLIRVLQDQPELIPKVIEVISKKKEYGSSELTITLKDIESFGLNLEIDKTNLVINSERSLSDGLQVSSYEEINLALSSRFKKMKELWMQRPSKTPLYPVSFILSKGKEAMWSFVMVVGKSMKKGLEALVDDGKNVYSLKVSSVKVFEGLIPGMCAAVKINPDGATIEDYEDVEFQEIKRKKAKGKIALISDLLIGSNRVDGLFSSIKSAKVDGVLFLGNIVDSYAYIKNGLPPAEGYRQAAKLVSSLPSRILKVFVPGPLDSTGRALPQKPLSYKVAKDLYSTQNSRILSNPSYVTINNSLFLLYNAKYLLESLPEYREEEAVRKVLKIRHMAPSFGTIPVVPFSSDKLIVEDVPDYFFVGGGREKVDFIYRGVWSVGVPSYKACKCYAIVDLGKESVEWVSAG